MINFDFYAVPRILFGRGQFKRIGELAAPFGQVALVVHNSRDAALIDCLTSLLAGAGIRPAFFRQVGEPQVEHIDAAVALGREQACELVIGLGGGSAIDAAKATAGLLTNGGGALDYMEVVGRGQKITRPAAPFLAVPLTAGTGAEATRNAVIGYPLKQFKASIRSEHLLPRLALIDPELGVGIPPHITASTGMDALCQLIESYTSTNAQPLTDALALQGMSLAARSLRIVYENGNDIDAREDMALAALFSGITLTNAGLGAVHGFAAPFGANFPIPHGTVCAALLPHVIAANIAALSAQDPHHPTLNRYATVGRMLTNRPDLPQDAALSAAIDFTAQLACDLAIPPLRQFSFSETDIAPMIALAKKASSMRYNPVVLSDAALAEILRRAL